ncbi:aquaporin [Rhodococcus sp. 05-340-1]|uniref:aquaporin n=1 Tax=unclassified Rhodococcus (in: high G+C Gram-positive bacteria) TaxID=192944 RepID=UPI000B9C3A56|nr:MULTISPECIES: aquaporin [unclassified Rhodococcus (in: high G+C Gram-positive bacteria)]OZD67053.1 aquaporin [Rhodococcus sp. 05-340-2]OZD81133.1 aquaporin [Rhodococcus sp. 05-340-1]
MKSISVSALAAEGLGTALLVIFGVGTAVIAGDTVGTPGIALAFGLTLLALVYAIGPISGCHINPAVTIGALIARAITPIKAAFYIAAQAVGAVIGALIVLFVASGRPGYDISSDGLGTNGFGSSSPGEYGLVSVAVFETIATGLLVLVVLATTAPTLHPVVAAGIPIGLTLTVVHLLGIGIDSTSVNPARSLGPALVAGGPALSQLWVFVVFPVLGAVIAGSIHRFVLTVPASEKTV